MSARRPEPWTLQESPAGGAILIRGGGDFRKHPQTHLQIVPIEDARLIAAAPRMLAVLEAFVKCSAERFPGYEGTEHPIGKMITEGRAAIQQAQGGNE